MSSKPLGPSEQDKREMQGDIWPGLGKDRETFYFFSITDPNDFKKKLKSMADNNILTSSLSAIEKRKQHRERKDNLAKQPWADPKDVLPAEPEAGINVSFSPYGMEKLSWNTETLEKKGIKALGDRYFEVGQKENSLAQGRDNPDEYEPWMKRHLDGTGTIHGVFLVCGTAESVKAGVARLEKELGGSIKHLNSQEGKVRDKKGYEHFGFRDTISQPRLDGWDEEGGIALPYKCRPGVIVINHPGTGNCDEEDYDFWEPEWAKNGSFFVFRKMEQLVPEFHRWAKESVEKNKDLNLNEEQFKARCVGRWPSGAPVQLHPLSDPGVPEGTLPNNKWDYEPPDYEVKCPFGSHIRKSNPRHTYPMDPLDSALIMRRGIPYGPDYDANDSSTRDMPRGLMFGCYQSNIQNGYAMIVDKWMNAPGFPFGGSGQDVIAGQPLKIRSDAPDEHKKLYVNMYGLNENGEVPPVVDGPHPNPVDKKKSVEFQSFVRIRGGEYFFTPPMTFFGRMVDAIEG